MKCFKFMIVGCVVWNLQPPDVWHLYRTISQVTCKLLSLDIVRISDCVNVTNKEQNRINEWYLPLGLVVQLL